MIKNPCQEIAQGLGQMFVCRPLKRFVRIETPFSLPDGDQIELFLEDDGSYISDMGETLRWLGDNSFSEQRTNKQMSLIDSICKTNRVKFERGSIMSRVDGDLCDVLIRVAQSCMRASDIAMSFKGKTIQTTTNDISDFLTKSKIIHERNVYYEGLSGKRVYLDFQIQAKLFPLVKVLSTTSKSQATRMVNNTLRTWSELEQHKDILKFISLFDDTMGDMWSSGDIKILEKHADVVFWSDKNSLIDAISA